MGPSCTGSLRAQFFRGGVPDLDFRSAARATISSYDDGQLVAPELKSLLALHKTEGEHGDFLTAGPFPEVNVVIGWRSRRAPRQDFAILGESHLLHRLTLIGKVGWFRAIDDGCLANRVSLPTSAHPWRPSQMRTEPTRSPAASI